MGFYFCFYFAFVNFVYTYFIKIYLFNFLRDEYPIFHKLIEYHISSSSCRTISTDLPDPLPPPFPTVHRFR